MLPKRANTNKLTMKNILWIFILSFASTACGLLGSDENNPSVPGKIVFAAGRTSQIFSMNADGSNVRRLTNFKNDEAFQPAWSPNGNQIVFEKTGATSLGPELYVMDANGNNLRPLKRRKEGPIEVLIGGNPDWSPDGSRIAYTLCTNCEIGGQDHEVVTVEVAGKTLVQDQIQPITDHLASDWEPKWSPDGSQIAFVSSRDFPDEFGSDIYLYNNKEADITKLTQTGNSGRPIWHPNGQNIFYWSENKLHDLNLSNMVSTPVTFEFSHKNGFRPLAISKDGKQILLIVFSLSDPRSDRSLQVLNLNNKELKTVFVNQSISGADWL